ncbi:MAG: hypothetical protein Ta2A_12270 [Treponemataceae bacterium]|nr:MAG: hypothetical protein Ta2A_12270 [Treponemataceae bacterium]
MKIYAVSLSMFVFLSACATNNNQQPPVSLVIPSDIAGVAHAGDPVSAAENALMDELGIVWVRNDFRWSRVEPQQGVWDFSRYDRMVEDNIASGRKMLSTLGFDTRWLHKNGNREDYISPEELPYFLDYVEKVVTRYKGKVDAWEIWNEPNVSVRFWKGPAKDFYALSKATAKKIRECDPNAKIIAGSFFRVPTVFIKNMFASGALDDIDGIAFHPYAITPKGALALYDTFAALMRKQGYTGEIWVTEVGYPTGGIYPSRVREKKFGAYIHDTLTGLAQRGARTIFWYQLTERYTRDNTPHTLNSERFFGLAYKDFEKKLGADEFAKTVRSLRQNNNSKTKEVR